MSEPKHTPKPWRVWPRLLQNGNIVIKFGKAGIVPEVQFNESCGLTEQKANARLIAAAPELLAACKGLADWSDGNHADFETLGDVCGAARAAIAKAQPR